MTIVDFTPGLAALGGLLIGLAAAVLMLSEGRIAGISGILGSLATAPRGERGWRAAFLAGLLAVPAAAWLLHRAPDLAGSPAAWPAVLAAGLLVGFGARLGSGCTSGHGVCGLARLSPRSLAATLVFMATAALTVFVTRHVLGG